MVNSEVKAVASPACFIGEMEIVLMLHSETCIFGSVLLWEFGVSSI